MLGQFGLNVLPLNTNGSVALSANAAIRLRVVGTASLAGRLTLSPSPSLRNRQIGAASLLGRISLNPSSAERLKAYGLPSFAPGTLRLYPSGVERERIIPYIWLGYFGIQFGEALPEWVDNPFLEPLPADSEPRELKARVYRSFSNERIR